MIWGIFADEFCEQVAANAIESGFLTEQEAFSACEKRYRDETVFVGAIGPDEDDDEEDDEEQED